jgi:hypothetical protein
MIRKAQTSGTWAALSLLDKKCNVGISNENTERLRVAARACQKQLVAVGRAVRPWIILAWRKMSPHAAAARRKIVPWAMGHKAEVLCGLLVLYIIFRPTRPPAFPSTAPAAVAVSPTTVPSIALPSHSQAAATQPGTASSDPNVVITYDSTQNGADPAWGLPAKLDTATQ